LTASRVNYGMVRNILQNHLDKVALQQTVLSLPDHSQIRGPEFYQ
jgi:hypothetical protein